MTDRQEGTAGVLPGVEVLSAEAGALTEAETGETGRCLKPPAATAERTVKYLSDPQTANLFTAVTVLKK